MSQTVPTRAALESRKQDLYEAIRALEQDLADGSMAEDVYRTTRRKYELEAAAILQSLDDGEPWAVGNRQPALSDNEGPRRDCGSVPVPPALSTTHGPRLIAHAPWLAAVALLAAAIALALFTALHQRGTGQTITGSQPALAATPVPQVSTQLAAAERRARSNPRSVDAQLALGTAYLNAGEVAKAHHAYQSAVRLDPSRPEAPTLDALAYVQQNQLSRALSILAGVERKHPRYARAWLEDGLIAARRRPGFPRAITDFKRFLALVPKGSVASSIRPYLARLEQAAGSSK